jgi:hypothetical protein
MKIINVDEKTRIAIDEGNCIVQKSWLNKKTNSIEWLSKSYYRDMADCATELLETLPQASQELTGDLKSIVTATNDAKDKILKALTNLNK